MGRYGTNLEGFGAFEGGVNADKGAPLVSTSSDGETAFIFGSAALRTIQAGVENGDFAIPPDAAGDTITEENPLPYWTWTPAALITAAIITDATAGSTNVFQVSCAAGSNLQTAYLTRFIAVATSGDRGKTYVPLFRFGAGTGASAQINVKCRYFKQDQTTAVGTEYDNSTTNGTATIIPTDLQFATVPSDAAYLKITIEFVGTVLANTSILQEVRVISGDSYIFLTEATPSASGPGQITVEDSPGRFKFNLGINVPAASVFDNSVEVASLTSTGAITATGNITATGDITAGGANSNLLARITATAAQSLTNNATTKVTFNTASSTPTTDSYDPQAWFDNANDRIVIGQAGFYAISANVGFATNATGRRLVQIYVNGADRGGVQVGASATATTILSPSTNVYLAVNDYVEVFATQQSGGALNTVSVTGVYPVLSVGRIGA